MPACPSAVTRHSVAVTENTATAQPAFARNQQRVRHRVYGYFRPTGILAPTCNVVIGDQFVRVVEGPPPTGSTSNVELTRWHGPRVYAARAI